MHGAHLCWLLDVGLVCIRRGKYEESPAVLAWLAIWSGQFRVNFRAAACSEGMTGDFEFSSWPTIGP